MAETYYEVLGVPRDADAAEISKAYRQHAKALHPDMPGGNADDFKRLNEAHEILGDPYKRGLYDLQTKLEDQIAEPASSTGTWINILASLAIGALGILFWMWGDQPGDAYNGYYVSLGWVAVLYAVGLFVDRHQKLSDPLTTAKRVFARLLYIAIGLLIGLSLMSAAYVVLAGLFALACWLYWLLF